MNYTLSDKNATDAFSVVALNVPDVLANKALSDEVVRLFMILTNDEVKYHSAIKMELAGKYTSKGILDALKTKKKVFLLKTADGKYIGMCWIGTSGYKDTNQLNALVIEPGYRGRGLGSKIINSVIATDPDKSISLTVSVANPHAVHLYRSLGFKDTDIKMVRHAN